MKHHKPNLKSSIYRVLLVVLAGLLVLGNFGRISITDKIVLNLQDGLLVCMAGIVLMHLREAITLLKKHAWFKPFGVFIGMIGISLIIALLTSEQNVLIGVAYAARYMLYGMFYPYLLIGLKRGYINGKQITLGMLCIVVSVAVLGLIQYVFLPDVRFLHLLGYDDHYYRLISTYFDPPFTAQLLIIGLFMLLGVQKRTKKTWIARALLFVALLLTYSRAEYVAFLAGVVTMLVQSGKKSVLFLIGLLAIGIVLLPRPASEGARLERTQSIIARVTVLTQSVQKLDTKTLLVGNGWYLSNTDREPTPGVSTSHSSSSDNSYFQVLESLGIIGLGAFLVFLWKVLLQYKAHPVALPIIVSILVGSIANNIFFYPAIMLFFWALLTAEAKHTD